MSAAWPVRILTVFITVYSVLSFSPTRIIRCRSRNGASANILHRDDNHNTYNTLVPSFKLGEKKSNFDDGNKEEIIYGEKEDLQRVLQGRIRTGETLDLFAISTIIFFLATVWLSGGRLINKSTTDYYSTNEGKSQVYKYVDADEILRKDFDRESSSVMF